MLRGKDAEEFLRSIESVTYSESKEKLLRDSGAAYKKYILKEE